MKRLWSPAILLLLLLSLIGRSDAPQANAEENTLQTGCSAAEIDAYLTSKGSPMVGEGAHFVAAGQQWDVDPRLIVAIAGAESSFGKYLCTDYNAWNWFYSGWCTSPFASWNEGIQSVTWGIRVLYFDAWRLHTIAAMRDKYCPGCTNWIPNVSAFYAEQGGDPNSSNLSFSACNQSQDATPPTTDHVLNGTQVVVWYISDVQVTLTPDDCNGSGVAYVRYRVDTQPWKQHDGAGAFSFTVSGEGTHTLRFYAVDVAGNPENEQSVSFKIDARPPDNPNSINPGCAASNNLWQHTCNHPGFTWNSANDHGGSGVAGYEYRWQTQTGISIESGFTGGASFAPSASVGDGVYVLRLRTQDNVGHWSEWGDGFVLRYDGTPPTITFQINDGTDTTNQTTILLNLSASDTGSSYGSGDSVHSPGTKRVYLPLVMR